MCYALDMFLTRLTTFAKGEICAYGVSIFIVSAFWVVVPKRMRELLQW